MTDVADMASPDNDEEQNDSNEFGSLGTDDRPDDADLAKFGAGDLQEETKKSML